MSNYKITSAKDTFVLSGRPAETSCQSPQLPVGNEGLGKFFDNNKFISYLFFDLSVIPFSRVITAAELTLFFSVPPFKGIPPKSFDIEALRDDFNDCVTSYNNRPRSLSKTNKVVPVSMPVVSISTDLTYLVKEWHTGCLANNGLALLPELSFSKGVLLFNSSQHPDSSRRPTLTVTVESPGKPVTESIEETLAVTVDDGFSTVQEVWVYSEFSFIVQNIGLFSMAVKLQDSADGINFVDEKPTMTLLPGATHIFVNDFFTRFSRLRFRLVPGEVGTGQIKIWLQGRQ